MKNKFLSFSLLTRRNILMFLTNKTTVFFSLLANIILLSLYLLFLKENYVSTLEEIASGFGTLDTKLMNGFINSYLISGILGTTCITVALNSLIVMVKDKEDKVDLDYKSSPISKVLVSLSYFIGALISTYIIGVIFLTIGLIALSIGGTMYLSVSGIISVYLILLLGCISSTTLMIIIASFFKSSSGLGAFGGIVSAVVGFLIGAYMPISQFSDSIQIFSNVLPASHVTGLLRYELLTPVLNEMNLSLGSSFTNIMSEVFALELNFFGTMISSPVMYVYVIVTSILLGALSVLVFKKLNK